MAENKLFLTMDLCRFCALEFPDCGAQPVFSKAIALEHGQLDSDESVVACDLYKSPVEILKKRFHDR